MRAQAFNAWVADRVAARYRREGRTSEGARAREHIARRAGQLLKRARERARNTPVRKTRTENAALTAARQTVVAEQGEWCPEMKAGAREIESALASVLIAEDAGWATEHKLEALGDHLARVDPHWGKTRAWRPTLGRMRTLAGLNERGWTALERAPAWAARRAALTLEGEAIEAGAQAWTERWCAGETGAARVLAHWRWPEVDPPLDAVTAWARAQRHPRTGAAWGASVEAQARAQAGERIEVRAIERDARSMRARVREGIVAEAHAVIEDMEGPGPGILAARQRALENGRRWDALHAGVGAKGETGGLARLRLVAADVREGVRWARRLAWEVKLRDAATLIASARSTETDWEARTTAAVRIDARWPERMTIVEWVPHPHAPSRP